MPANIAILIDAENVDPSFANQIFGYARSLGEVSIREIYGAGIALNEWADPILENTIHPNFTLRPNRFKNSSDIALTIGAMVVLHEKGKNNVDAVIIASSDSDFSPLAFHLRAAGIDVIGMGEPGRINPMWPKACTEFVELKANAPLVRKRDPDQQLSAVSPAEEVSAGDEAPSTQRTADMPIAPTGEDAPKDVQEAAPAERRKKIVIAPSHPARVEIIRQFIAEQLSVHGGRIKSGELFKALGALPDYKYDQQRSRRKPLDYLDKQFGEWFILEPGEKGSYWISAKTAEKPADDHQTDEPTADQEPETPDELTAENETKAEDGQADTEPDTLPDGPRTALIEAGIPVHHAGRIASILSESKNMFSAYNGLTSAFGRKQGKEYYRLIKEHFISVPDTVSTADSASTSSTEPTVNAALTEDTAPAKPVSQESGVPDHDDVLGNFLIDKGVPAGQASGIAKIVAETPNLRIAYNELRKAFGAVDGRTYLSLVKEFQS